MAKVHPEEVKKGTDKSILHTCAGTVRILEYPLIRRKQTFDYVNCGYGMAILLPLYSTSVQINEVHKRPYILLFKFQLYTQ